MVKKAQPFLNCLALNCSHSVGSSYSHSIGRQQSHGPTWMQRTLGNVVFVQVVASQQRLYTQMDSAYFGKRLAYSATSSLKTSNLSLPVQVTSQMKPFLASLHRTNSSSHYCFAYNSVLALNCTYCIQHTTGVQGMYVECIFLYCKGSLLCRKKEEAHCMILRDPFFLAFSFLICGQAR